MKKYIQSAKLDASESLLNAYDNLQADFSYAVAGIEQLVRSGREGEKTAAPIIDELDDAIQDVISTIASLM